MKIADRYIFRLFSHSSFNSCLPIPLSWLREAHQTWPSTCRTLSNNTGNMQQ